MNQTDDIARYAEGLMEADEQAAFEARLAADASLQQQLALYREVHTTLQDHFTHDDQREQLRRTLQGMRAGFFTGMDTPPARVIPFKRYLRSAVAVAAILIAVVFIWQPWKPGLFEEYAQTTMVAPVERGGESDRLLEESTVAFNKEDFTTAASKLEQLMRDTTNSYVAFYYGVSLMRSGRLPAAKAVLYTVYSGYSAFKYDALYYYALCFLKENDKENCITWLQKVPSDAPNYDKSRELLKKLQ